MIGTIAAAGINAAANIWNNNKQAKLQKQFAQSGIQWKVADAKKAGIHPIYALGSSGASYSPQALSLGDSLSSAGQSVDNAIHRSSDVQTRRMGELQLEKAGLENEYLRTQITSLRSNRTGSPPPIPTPGRTVDPTAPPAPEHRGLRDTWGSVPGVTLTDPASSDAQKVQDRYGDIIENIYGIRNWLYDHAYTRHGFPLGTYHELNSMRTRRGQDFGRHYRHR